MIKAGMIHFFNVGEGDVLNDLRKMAGKDVGPGWYWFEMNFGTEQPMIFSGPFASEQEAQDHAVGYVKSKYTVLDIEIHKDVKIH